MISAFPLSLLAINGNVSAILNVRLYLVSCVAKQAGLFYQVGTPDGRFSCDGAHLQYKI